MKKIFLLGIGLMVSAVNVNAMGLHEGPFIGINTFNDKCQASTEGNSFRYMGEGKTKFSMNQDVVVATCKADVDDSETMVEYMAGEEAIVEKDIPCRIAVKKTGAKKMTHYDGIGRFTVTPSGNINGHCKHIINP